MSLLLAAGGGAPPADDPVPRFALLDESWQPDDDFEGFSQSLDPSDPLEGILALFDEYREEELREPDFQAQFVEDVADDPEARGTLYDDWLEDEQAAQDFVQQVIEDAVIISDDPEARIALYEDWQESDEYDLSLIDFFQDSDVSQGGGGLPAPKRKQYVLRRKEYKFLEELGEVLELEAPKELEVQASTTPKQLRTLQRLSKAYQMEVDSINAAISFIEQRKLELLIEDEMAIILIMMADEA